VVADLGCGCGTLGIAALLLDAAQVVGVDVDGDALLLAHENCNELEVHPFLLHNHKPQIITSVFVHDTPTILLSAGLNV
jgi:predicted RNA methylase